MEVLRKLGRYDLVRVLGKGAMGVVYEGQDPSLGRRVAVKTILRNAAVDPETERTYAQRFAQEARAVARLNHPNIVQVYDYGVEDDVAYLVMEFIDGRELRSLFESGERLPLAEVVRLMGELLDALDFAHEAGVIHRDVKPANVLLDAQRRLKLADFGVARVQDGTQRTQADTMVGSPAYMSPEQISGARIDRRTDIFAAGVVLYQFLTGDKPFKGDTPWAVLAAIAQAHPPAPSTLVPGLPPAFDAVVDAALVKDPAARYPTARAFATALKAALAGTATELPTVFPGAALPPRPEPAPAAPAASVTQTPSATSDAELEFWRSVQNTADPAELETYIAQFPQGTYSALARVKLSRMRAGAAADADPTLPPAAARPPQTAAPLPPAAPNPTAKSPAMWAGAALGAAVLAGGGLWWARAPAPAPAPVAQAPATTAVPLAPAASAQVAPPAAPAVTPADDQARLAQAAASQAAADRVAAEKAAARAAAEREQMARDAKRIAEDKLAAEKAAAAAAAERAAAERVAADRAAAEKAAADKAAAEQASARPAARPGSRPVAEALAARAAERRAALAPPAPASPAATESRTFANEDTDWGVAPTRVPRVKPLHAPTPLTVPGGTTITTLDLKKRLATDKSVVVVDVLDTKARQTVPGAAWLPGAGQGRLGPPAKAGFANALRQLTDGDRDRPLVFLCLNAECWLSYNAALHAIEAGYTRVLWYRGGTDAWTGAGLPRSAPRRVDW